MGKISILVIIGFFVAVPAVAADESDNAVSAVVSAIVRSDAVRLTIGEDEVLAGLYGVTNAGASRETCNSARDYLVDAVLGAEVQARFRTKVAGLDFVEIVLPSGDNLNLLMLSSGLAHFDHLSAGGDAAYRAAVDSAAHEPDTGTRPSHTASDEGDSEAEQPPGRGAPMTMEEFRWRRQLVEQAKFEAGLEKWRRMPLAYRHAVYRHYSDSLREHMARSTTVMSQLESKRLSDTLDIIDAQLSIEASKSSIAAEKARGDADPDLRWNTRMYQNYLNDFMVDSLLGNSFSARLSHRSASRYAARATLDRARVNQEVASRVLPLVENVRALEATAKAREESVASLNMRLRNTHIRAEDGFRRLQGALQTVRAYDAAIAKRTQPLVPMRPVQVLDHDDFGRRVDFDIAGSIWRIDWYFEALGAGSVLAGDVFSAADDAFVARFSSSAMPHEALLILEGPGSYYIAVNTTGVSRYIIQILELDYP